MRKVNVLVGTVSLGLGILIGVVSLAVAGNPATSSQLLSQFHLGTNNMAVTSQGGTNGQSPGVTPSSPLSVAASGEAPQSLGGEGLSNSNSNSDSTLGNIGDSSNSMGSVNPEATLGGQASIPATTVPRSDSNRLGSTTPVLPALAQQVTADYKQDIGIFFDAWKSQDMTAFRSKLAKAYAGELLDRHARRAEQFISKGVGLEVSKIDFDNVTVEKADTNTATLRADYRYTASDYVLTSAESVGESKEQTVHTRVNLVKTNQRWIITGETILN
ncbi:MAG: hypothetical protein ACYCVD_12440 [Desulfitobacteriaceae bacterium]